ncbi:TrkA C-terminal domain-containing protein [Spiroplasma endosymbiont of Tricholauxania praeusta]|uniref:TrkA C-terminal domain-containing protein n=1 Tax=Spiroplasma endosymbiont of Tricholauxania praeusta TaxID=3066296 RepID=UPI0030CBAABB
MTEEVIAPTYNDGAKKTFESHILTDVEKTTATNKIDTETGKYIPYWDSNFLNGANLETLKIPSNYKINLVAIKRHGKVIIPSRNEILMLNDELLFQSIFL